MPYTEVMHKWKAGALHSGGPSGPVVHDQKQAVAIMLSEKRKAEQGKEEYQPKTPARHPLGRLRHRLAKPSRFDQGGEVQQTGMALVHKGEQVLPAGETTPMRNAREWREQGYNAWKKGDAARERQLPIGGQAPIRPEPTDPLNRLKRKFGK